jgi:hypothetical protein
MKRIVDASDPCHLLLPIAAEGSAHASFDADYRKRMAIDHLGAALQSATSSP